jgi:hypothetical protein
MEYPMEIRASRPALILALSWVAMVVAWAVVEFEINNTLPERPIWIERNQGYLSIDWMRVTIAALAPAALILFVGRTDGTTVALRLRSLTLSSTGFAARLWVIVAVAWSSNVFWHVFLEWQAYDPENQFSHLILRDWFRLPEEHLHPEDGIFGKAIELRYGKLLAAIALPLLAAAAGLRWAAAGLRQNIRAETQELVAGKTFRSVLHTSEYPQNSEPFDGASSSKLRPRNAATPDLTAGARSHAEPTRRPNDGKPRPSEPIPAAAPKPEQFASSDPVTHASATATTSEDIADGASQESAVARNAIALKKRRGSTVAWLIAICALSTSVATYVANASTMPPWNSFEGLLLASAGILPYLLLTVPGVMVLAMVYRVAAALSSLRLPALSSYAAALAYWAIAPWALVVGKYASAANPTGTLTALTITVLIQAVGCLIVNASVLRLESGDDLSPQRFLSVFAFVQILTPISASLLLALSYFLVARWLI